MPRPSASRHPPVISRIRNSPFVRTARSVDAWWPNGPPAPLFTLARAFEANPLCSIQRLMCVCSRARSMIYSIPTDLGRGAPFTIRFGCYTPINGLTGHHHIHTLVILLTRL